MECLWDEMIKQPWLKTRSGSKDMAGIVRMSKAIRERRGYFFPFPPTRQWVSTWEWSVLEIVM
jgi:hypothetical protein